MNEVEAVVRTRTARGEYVSPTSGVCNLCASSIAVVAAYWTDDAEFEYDPDWTSERRFLQLQKSVTNTRASCVANCGRSEES